MPSWYVNNGSRTLGPFTDAELQAMASKGEVRRDHLVRSDESAGWFRAAEVHGLFSASAAGSTRKIVKPGDDPVPAAAEAQDRPADVSSRWAAAVAALRRETAPAARSAASEVPVAAAPALPPSPPADASWSAAGIPPPPPLPPLTVAPTRIAVPAPARAARVPTAVPRHETPVLVPVEPLSPPPEPSGQGLEVDPAEDAPPRDFGPAVSVDWERIARLAVLGCAVTVVLTPLTFLAWRGCRPAATTASAVVPDISKSDQLRLGARVLALYLADRYPGCQVLIISPPPGQRPGDARWHDAIREGLERGFGRHLRIAADDYPRSAEPAPSGASTGRPGPQQTNAGAWATAAAFDAVLARHADCLLVVSLVGLPADFGSMEVWKLPAEKRPKIAVALGPWSHLGSALLSEQVVAVLDQNADSTMQYDFLDSDIEGDFRSYCRLLTPDNVSAVASRSPGLFHR